MKRGLIIRKQWLDLIFDHGKIWEMRSRHTNIRGKIYLIESGSGLIVGEAELIDCLSPYCDDIIKHYNRHQISDKSLLKKWKWPWVLKGAIRYSHPIAYKHPKGAVVWVNLDK